MAIVNCAEKRKEPNEFPLKLVLKNTMTSIIICSRIPYPIDELLEKQCFKCKHTVYVTASVNAEASLTYKGALQYLCTDCASKDKKLITEKKHICKCTTKQFGMSADNLESIANKLFEMEAEEEPEIAGLQNN